MSWRGRRPDLPAWLWGRPAGCRKCPPLVDQTGLRSRRVAATFGPDEGLEQTNQPHICCRVGSICWLLLPRILFFLMCVYSMQQLCRCVCVYRFICSFIYIYLQKFLQCIVDGLIGRRKSSEKGNGDGIDRLFLVALRCTRYSVPARPVSRLLFRVWLAAFLSVRVNGCGLP